MDKRKLSELLVEHKEKAFGDHAFTPREILAQAADMARQKEIHVITGVRRSGKSTLMRLIARYLIREENAPPPKISSISILKMTASPNSRPRISRPSTRPISKSNPRRAASISS